MAAGAQSLKKRNVSTPQIIRSHGNYSDSANNKRFVNMDGLLQHASKNTRKRKHSETLSTPQRDTTSPQQMSRGSLHQRGDEMEINEDESKNINQGLST